MKISVIIPFKSDQGGYRDFNFYHIKKRYETLMPDLEFVIGEDQSECELYNKARAVNRAVSKATGDLLIIADADVFFGTQLIDKIKAIVHRHPWIIPFSCGYKLNREAFPSIIQNGRIELPRRLRFNEIEAICAFHGAFINVMSRSAFERVGGMDERFSGWGEEDQSFARALDTLVGKHYRMSESVFHLWHPPADYNHANRKLNQQLAMRYVKAERNIFAMKRLVEEWRK